MLVDINLLPKKEKKNYSGFILSLLLGLFTLLVVFIAIFLTWITDDEMRTVSSKLHLEKTAVALLETQVNGGIVNGDFSNVVEALETNTFPVAETMLEIVKAVPNNGVVEGFQVAENQIDLTITTDRNEHAVHYFNSLQEIETISEVTIHSISYFEEEDTYSSSYTILLQDESEGVESDE